MYIPDSNKWEDHTAVQSFILQYSFAQFITTIEGKSHATALPFLTGEVNGKAVLLSHLALANPQSQQIEGKEHLIIFQEPHAFIPEALYDRRSVPTWDYLSVHIYGVGHLIDDIDSILTHLKRTSDHYEPDFWSRWPDLPTPYKRGLLNDLKCFYVEITEIQPKAKMSQNRTKKERKQIQQYLSRSDDATAQNLSQYFTD